MILLQQRVHALDLSGTLLAQGGWDHLKLSSIAEQDETIMTPFRSFFRAVGEALHAERESLASLAETKAKMTSLDFSAQYQQSPIPEVGNLVQRNWINFYGRAPQRSTSDLVVQSWDTATKGGPQNDFSVCATFLVRGSEYYLIDVVRERCDYPSLKRLLVDRHSHFKPTDVLIEDAGAGSVLIQELRRSHGVAAKPIRPTRDKISRFATSTGAFENGQINLPDDAPWLAPFLEEILSVPQCQFDDQVDAVSQFLGWIRDKPVFDFDFGKTTEDDTSFLRGLPEYLLSLRGQ
jgi:predicted phage terminase large subunit-like protein